MFVEKPKEEVYDIIAKERVLILVSLDVDALCSCKILQWLFQRDHVQYTIVPVDGKEELKATFDEYKDQLNHFVLLNCGGNINLVNDLEANESVVFYVADSRRPLDLDNVYNQDQVKIMIKDGDTFDEIPEFEKIYPSDDEDDDEGINSDDQLSEADEGSEPSSKRQRTEETPNLDKRRKKRRWIQQREKTLFDYYEYSSYGTPAAMIMFELAWKMSKDNNDILWWGILGLTEHYLYRKIDRETYVQEVQNFHEHVLRHNVNDEDNTVSVNCMKIVFEDELRLCLYRHWSLYESICHSQYTACGFKVWTMKGRKKLHEFLANMGLPIAQCKQKFTSMDVDLKLDIQELIKNSAQKFGLNDINMGSFVAQYGFKQKLCASDVVYAVNAVLENTIIDRPFSENFLEALDVLSRNNVTKMQGAIELAKQQVEALVIQVRSFIDMHQIVCAGPFLYAHVQEGTSNAHQFARPQAIRKLASFTLNAYLTMTRNKKAPNLPFILAVPLDKEEGTCLLTGVPPSADDSMNNFFGAAFEQAAEKTKTRTRIDCFDQTVIEIKSEDRSKFFDALSALLV